MAPCEYWQWPSLCARCGYGLEKIAQHLSDKDFIWESGTRAWIYTNNQISGFPKNYTSWHRKDKQLGFALCNMLILHSKTTTKTTALGLTWNLTVSANKHQFLTTNSDSFWKSANIKQVWTLVYALWISVNLMYPITKQGVFLRLIVQREYRFKWIWESNKESKKVVIDMVKTVETDVKI